MRHITHTPTNKPFAVLFLNPSCYDSGRLSITKGARAMMDYDDYLISTFGIDDGDETIDGEHPDNIPSAWHHIVDFDIDQHWEARQLDLQDWFEGRVTDMLGEDGADHMDVRMLVQHWVDQGLVESMCGSWFFTRDEEAKIWLPAK